MIHLLIAVVALTWYLIWMNKHIGIPTSISSTFYENKTRWTYTMVIAGIGGLMSFVDPGSLLHYAGFSLILGTAAPDFKHESSMSKLFHFAFTGATAILGWAYLGGWWLGLAGGVLIGGSKLIEAKFPKAVFWAELVLFYSVLIGALLRFI